MYGEFHQRMDDKGRMILPARARAELTGAVFLAKGPDRCIYVFTPEQFAEFKRSNEQKAPPGIDPRAFDRLFAASVSDQTPDKQGRIVIPIPLRSYAGLQRDLTVIGVGTRIEIWDAEAWQAYQARYDDLYAEIPGEMR